MQKELIAELRNKLSPIKNYLTMQREYESLTAKKGNGDNYSSFLDGYKSGGLLVKIEEEKLKAESAMSKVELIIELMEKLEG